MKPNLCIFHGNCADGFTAAWVVRNALGEENVDFVPGFYGKTLPDAELINLPNYEVVYMVDFSYKRKVLIDVFAARCKRIIIIDHHKTAQEDLVDLSANVECHFDMDHSGAMLTWMYFVKRGAIPVYIPGANSNPSPMQSMPEDFHKYAPALIQCVEDRDLWRFKFSDTRAVAAKMFSHEYTFENWDMMAHEYQDTSSTKGNELRDIFVAEGEAIERKHFKDIKELLEQNQTKGAVCGHLIPIANLPYTMSSDAASMMAVDQPFALCYSITKDGIAISLRSEKDKGVDVSEIAKQLGGGGHKHASGVNLTWQQYSELGGNLVLGF